MPCRRVFCLAALALACLISSCTKSSSLISITITPPSASISATGETAQFKAIGTYSKGGSHPPTTQDITDEATWASSSTDVATVDSTGLATAVGTGTATITATMNGSSGPVIGTASLTVTGGGMGGQRELTSITITPGTQTLNTIGATAQFIAIGNYTTAPTTVDLTNAATWNSSSSSVATISSSGTATAIGCAASSCIVTMTASYLDPVSGTIVGTASLTVSTGSTGGTPQLTAITIIPSTQTLNTAGEQTQFIALGTYNAPPTTQDITNSVTWQSSTQSVAAINSTTGLATVVGCNVSTCVTTITACSGSGCDGSGGSSIIGAAALTVSPGTSPPPRALSAITILPGAGSQTLYTIGETSQFIAIGTYTAAPTTADLTGAVTWVSSDVGIAAINPSGLATAIACPIPTCTSNITASFTDPVSGFIVGTSNIAVEPNGESNLPSLSVYLVGAGTGSVVSTPPGISCSGVGTLCTGYFTQGTTVTLTATGSSFAGWSANCTPDTSNSCTITMSTNETVGAIFN